MKKLNKKGFTLTEMIVVIAIIGILAAVLIPSVVIYVQRAQRSNDEQLAASMTDEIERYCIENNIDQEDLLGTDVLSILAMKEYNLAPSRDKWTYVYDAESGIVSVSDISTVVIDTNHDYIDPTNFRGNLYLLGNGKSDIEKVVNILCKVQSLATFEKAESIAEDNAAIAKLVQHFDPSHTLYISNTKVFAEYKAPTKDANENVIPANYKFTEVVFTEKTVHIPGFIGSNLYNKANVTLSFDTTSAILKTIEKDSELSSQFLKLKVMDDSNLLILNDQFKDDIDDLFVFASGDIDEEGSYNVLNPTFKFGDNYETALFMSFSIIPVEQKQGADGQKHITYRFTINYYNENGLFARAQTQYSK